VGATGRVRRRDTRTSRHGPALVRSCTVSERGAAVAHVQPAEDVVLDTRRVARARACLLLAPGLLSKSVTGSHPDDVGRPLVWFSNWRTVISAEACGSASRTRASNAGPGHRLQPCPRRRAASCGGQPKDRWHQTVQDNQRDEQHFALREAPPVAARSTCYEFAHSSMRNTGYAAAIRSNASMGASGSTGKCGRASTARPR